MWTDFLWFTEAYYDKERIVERPRQVDCLLGSLGRLSSR